MSVIAHWTPPAVYWRLRHWHWDRAEDRFVCEVVRRLGDHDRLYVHPENGGPASIVIEPYDPLREYDHDHVEGRRPYPGGKTFTHRRSGGQ